ncbi:hypothetical protein HanXRQr2_Chr12g0530271 [Helianthus annuus]|uniref:Uncharacterized protein n=1 Tax=Helianthus annuus TaxID=4232 RepID=A0A9K3HEX5_HELAN|nr:hypothetical protein HanXRQr2_Chr12g0530271 [Helianthus annuus]KAJ0861819.1 hypothetical protein HanPSC8_Chr12g0510941 [Helianthus annuus]
MILVIQYFVKSFSNQVKLDFEIFTNIVFRSWSHILKNRVIFSLNDLTVVLLMDCVCTLCLLRIWFKYELVDSDILDLHVCCFLVELIRKSYLYCFCRSNVVCSQNWLLTVCGVSLVVCARIFVSGYKKDSRICCYSVYGSIKSG